MRLRLSHKLFAAFFLNSLAIVGLMAVMQYVAALNFADYVREVEMRRLDDMVERLGREYRESGSWDYFGERPYRWPMLLNAHGFSLAGGPHPPGAFPRPPAGGGWNRRLPAETLRPVAGESGRPYGPEGRRPVPPWRGFPAPPLHERSPHDGPDRALEGASEDGEPLLPPPVPVPPQGVWPEDPYQIGGRLSLFDADRRLVIGNPVLTEQSLRPITNPDDETVVGYLGLKTREQVTNPAELDFLRQQARLYLIAGSVVLILTTIVSFAISRHILKPIRMLIRGTRAIRNQKLDTRIHVRTRDELQELASNFNEMARSLQKYEKMRRQWISDISHELRTPLAVLRGEIEAVLDGVRKLSRRTLDSLHGEVLRLTRLVNDLHLLSTADSRTLMLDRKPVKVRPLVARALSNFRHRLADRGIEINSNVEEIADVTLIADADRLAQIFTNILENTLRYADAPGTLKVRHRLKNGSVTLSFEDSGPGVPEESLEKLFDRLYRVDKSRSRELGGSGLGLAICKEIVEGHGGVISAGNGRLGGLRISIHLPLPGAE